MRTEDLKKILLKMFRGKEFYGYEVHKRLASENVKIEIGRLYRVLTEMLKEGLLEARWEKSRFGPRKRVYRLGRTGNEELHKILWDAIETVQEICSDYLSNLLPEANVSDGVRRLLIDQLKGHGSIACIARKYSATHERLMYNLHGGIRHVKIYLVKPESVAVDLKLDNVLLLDGAFDDIPLKDCYVDLLVVTGMPRKDPLGDGSKGMAP